MEKKDKPKENKFKKYYPILFIFSFFIVLHHPIEILLTCFLVNPILSKVSPDNFTNFGIIVLLIISLIFFDRFCRKKIVIPATYQLVILLFLTIYFYYRFFGSTWKFTGFKGYEKVKYTDIIFVSVLPLLSQLYFKLKKKQPKTNLSSFVEERPIENIKDDSFQRSELAKKLIDKILNTKNKNSFAIGIYGKWGSGKTSFLNLIKEKIKDKNVIEIDFNPWLNYDAKTILIDFFDTLKSHLSKEHLGISRLIDNYKKSLNLSIGNSLFKMILHQNNNSLSDEEKKLKEAIRQIDKKVIIYIDDIDRLQAEEIFQVMKLIRNSVNFPNVFFIVTFSRDYVLEHLDKITNNKAAEYLQKIFQLEIPLPDYEDWKIRNKLWNLLGLILLEKQGVKCDKITECKDKCEQIDDCEIVRRALYNKELTGYNREIKYKQLESFRDIHRFINSFKISYEKLAGEVNVIDLINLEILRSKYPDVYDLMFMNKQIKLLYDPKDFIIFSSITGDSFIHLKKQNEEMINENNDKSQYYLDVIKEKLKYNEGQINAIEELLESLFPETVSTSSKTTSIGHNDKSNELKINDPRYFKVYLAYRLMNSSISHKKFIDAFNKGYDSLKEEIDNWISNKNIKFDDIEKKIIEVVMLNCNDFKTKLFGLRYLYYKNKNIIESDFEFIYKLLNNYKELKKKHCFSNEKEYHIFIENFLKAEEKEINIDFRFDFIINMFWKTLKPILEEKRIYEFILPRDRFEQLIMSIFEEYVDKSKHIKKDDWWNFFTMFKQMDDKYKPRVKELMLDLINKDIDKFLCSLISGKLERGFLIEKIWDTLFKDFKEFENFVKQIKNSKYKDEFLEFYYKIKEKSDKLDGTINYRFKKMKSCIKKKQPT